MCRDHGPHHPRAHRRDVLKAIGAASFVLAVPVLTWPRGGVASTRLAPDSLPMPGPMDTCPVCGMLVAKYREWIATVAFTDGYAAHFDGAKDMFKYLLDMPRYAKDRALDQVVGMAVTEYYDLARIDPEGARFVVGSDVLGPMGHELIPLANEADAAEFLADHKGKAALGADQVSLALLRGLDDGDFSEAVR